MRDRPNAERERRRVVRCFSLCAIHIGYKNATNSLIPVQGAHENKKDDPRCGVHVSRHHEFDEPRIIVLFKVSPDKLVRGTQSLFGGTFTSWKNGSAKDRVHHASDLRPRDSAGRACSFLSRLIHLPATRLASNAAR